MPKATKPKYQATTRNARTVKVTVSMTGTITGLQEDIETWFSQTQYYAEDYGLELDIKGEEVASA